MVKVAALEERVGGIERTLIRLEAGIEGIRHGQNIGLGVVGLFVAVVGILVTIGIFEVQGLGSAVSATNVRLDHQLEQQATSASAAQAAANARMDRLLELYAQQLRAPNGQPSPSPTPAPAPAPAPPPGPMLRPAPSSLPSVGMPLSPFRQMLQQNYAPSQPKGELIQ